jgi:hypothetical protein
MRHGKYPFIIGFLVVPLALYPNRLDSEASYL